MRIQATKISRFIYAAGILLPFVCLINITQAYSNDTDSLGTVKSLLRASGIKAEMIKLQRSDGFSKAVFIEGPQKIPLIIGFNQDKADGAVSFLISIDGEEEVISVNNDGSFETDTVESSDLAAQLCIINAVFNMLISVENCDNDNLCVATSIFTFVIEIISCSNTQI